jgi:hypothetical protein
MAFQLSPGVLVTEKDLTSIVPAIATTAGGFAGAFQWGPVDEVTTVDSENRLVQFFGKPNDTVAQSFFTAANFLTYGNNLQVVRAVDKSIARNSTATLKRTVTGLTVLNPGTADGGANGNSNATTVVTISAPDRLFNNTTATATAIISGNTLQSIYLTNPGKGYTVNANITVVISDGANNLNTSMTGRVDSANDSILITYLDSYLTNNASGNQYDYGMWAGKYPGTLGDSIKVSIADANTWSSWEFAGNFDSAPTTSVNATSVGATFDEVHIIVTDVLGKWTGIKNSVLEKYSFLSKASDAKSTSGASIYYKDVINNQSQYIWFLDHPSATQFSANVLAGTFNKVAWGTPLVNGKLYENLTSNVTVTLLNGVSGDVVTDGNLITAFSVFSNSETYDVSLIPTGAVSTTVLNSVITIAENRKDCVVFGSPLITDVVNATNQATKVISTRSNLTSSSYAVMDSGWKYQYDRYNDVYRWVPLNGDIAGLAARTDFVADPWFSPAGFSRGQIRNVVKLAYSPDKTDRDNLYKSGINPVVSFPGQGTVLFGDKTLLSKPSAFDRINVRRLFIILEKSISTAARFQLFEFNDDFTRAQFVNLVEPFLRDVKGRRGVTDFKVVCDETNNTGEVIDRNEFVADIFVKPARSINFIQLNFVATRTGISFEETGI